MLSRRRVSRSYSRARSDRTARRRPAFIRNGSSRDGSNGFSGVRPISCQPPGVSAGVDAGLHAGDADRAGRHAHARRRAPRHRDARVDDAEIGKAGHEAEHEDAIGRARMARDDLGLGHAARTPRRRRDRDRARRRSRPESAPARAPLSGGDAARLRRLASSRVDQRVVVGAQRIEVDRDRAIGRHDVADARRRRAASHRLRAARSRAR